MDIHTSELIDISVLPECAVCKASDDKLNPMDMDYCPLCRFDDEGMECIPDLCEYYTEEE